VTFKPVLDLESPEFLKIIVIGYGLTILSFLTLLVSSGNRLAVFKNPTIYIPSIFLFLGFLTPFLAHGIPELGLPDGIPSLLHKPGNEDVSPFNPATATGLPFNPAAVTGFMDRGDTFGLVRLSAWYNYHAIGNPLGGPIINAFAVLGMIFGSRSAGGGIVTKLLVAVSVLGCAGFHLKWVFESFQRAGGVDSLQAIAAGTQAFNPEVAEAGAKLWFTDFWNNTMLTQSDAPAYPGFHEGKKGFMPASYAVDYFGMVAVSFVYGVFGAPGIVGKIKHLLITIFGGGATGLILAVKGAMLPDKKDVQSASLIRAIPFLLTAVWCIYIWMPFQMLWIDYVVTPHGRLNGGLINDDAKYCTLSVVLPYFALCAVTIAAYSRQGVPTLVKGVLFFNAAAFLFFQIAAASAIMIGMCYFWGPVGPEVDAADVAAPSKKDSKKRR